MTDEIKQLLIARLDEKIAAIDFFSKGYDDKVENMTSRIDTLQAELQRLQDRLAQLRQDDERRQRERAEAVEAREELMNIC